MDPAGGGAADPHRSPRGPIRPAMSASQPAMHMYQFGAAQGGQQQPQHQLQQHQLQQHQLQQQQSQQQQQQQQQQHHQQQLFSQQQHQQPQMPVRIAAAPETMTLPMGGSSGFDTTSAFANNPFMASLPGVVPAVDSQHVPRGTVGGTVLPGSGAVQNQTSRDFFGELEKALAGDAPPSGSPADAGFELLDDALALRTQPAPQQNAMVEQSGVSAQLSEQPNPHGIQSWQQQVTGQQQMQRNVQLQPATPQVRMEHQEQQLRQQRLQHAHLVQQQQHFRNQHLQQQHLQQQQMRQQHFRQQQNLQHHQQMQQIRQIQPQTPTNVPRGSSSLRPVQPREQRLATTSPQHPSQQQFGRPHQFGSANFQQVQQGLVPSSAMHLQHPMNAAYGTPGFTGRGGQQSIGQMQITPGRPVAIPPTTGQLPRNSSGNLQVEPTPQKKGKTKSARKQSQRRPRSKGQSKNVQSKNGQSKNGQSKNGQSVNPSPPRLQPGSSTQQFAHISPQQLQSTVHQQKPQLASQHMHSSPPRQPQPTPPNRLHQTPTQLQPAVAGRNDAYQQRLAGMDQAQVSGLPRQLTSGARLSSGQQQHLQSSSTFGQLGGHFGNQPDLQRTAQAGAVGLVPNELQAIGNLDSATLQNLLSRTSDPKLFAVLKQQLEVIRAGHVSKEGSLQGPPSVENHANSSQRAQYAVNSVGLYPVGHSQQIPASDFNATSQAAFFRNQQLRQQELHTQRPRQLQGLYTQPTGHSSHGQGVLAGQQIAQPQLHTRGQVSAEPQNAINPHANRSVASLPQHVQHQIQAQIQAQHIQAQLQGHAQGHGSGNRDHLSNTSSVSRAAHPNAVTGHSENATPATNRKPRRSPTTRKLGSSHIGSNSGGNGSHVGGDSTQANTLQLPSSSSPNISAGARGQPLVALESQTAPKSSRKRSVIRSRESSEASQAALSRANASKRAEESRKLAAERKRLAHEAEMRDIAEQKRRRLDIAPTNDYHGVLAPDYKTPFTGQVNAWQRLLPFHVALSKDHASVSPEEWNSSILNLSLRYKDWFAHIKAKHARVVQSERESVYTDGVFGTCLNNEECVTMEQVLLEDSFKTARQEEEKARKVANLFEQQTIENLVEKTNALSSLDASGTQQAASQTIHNSPIFPIGKPESMATGGRNGSITVDGQAFAVSNGTPTDSSVPTQSFDNRRGEGAQYEKTVVSSAHQLSGHMIYANHNPGSGRGLGIGFSATTAEKPLSSIPSSSGSFPSKYPIAHIANQGLTELGLQRHSQINMFTALPQRQTGGSPRLTTSGDNALYKPNMQQIPQGRLSGMSGKFPNSLTYGVSAREQSSVPQQDSRIGETKPEQNEARANRAHVGNDNQDSNFGAPGNIRGVEVIRDAPMSSNANQGNHDRIDNAVQLQLEDSARLNDRATREPNSTGDRKASIQVPGALVISQSPQANILAPLSMSDHKFRTTETSGVLKSMSERPSHNELPSTVEDAWRRVNSPSPSQSMAPCHNEAKSERAQKMNTGRVESSPQLVSRQEVGAGSLSKGPLSGLPTSEGTLFVQSSTKANENGKNSDNERSPNVERIDGNEKNRGGMGMGSLLNAEGS